MNKLTVRQRARDIVARYNPEGLVPFPFHEMAKRLGNIKLVFTPLEAADSISGAIFLQSSNLFVAIIDQQQSEAQQYFTTAHELGHFFLHEFWLRNNRVQGVVDYPELLDGQCIARRAGGSQEISVDLQKEREANMFAAELLMPEDKVQEFWDATEDIDTCARAFRVSLGTMAQRLERLHLV